MENMDKEDAKEFADEFKKREKMLTKRKWQKWKQDAEDAAWLGISDVIVPVSL